jgi:FKBP-type peptidyl-prolyl cis-trans isomerase
MTESNSQNINISELIVEDITIGTGPEVVVGNHILIDYAGTLLDGTPFDSSYSRNQPLDITIGVGQVIQGWDMGITGEALENVKGLQVGGERKLTIPAKLAYGSREIPGLIPANSPLVFTVKLIAIV